MGAAPSGGSPPPPRRSGAESRVSPIDPKRMQSVGADTLGSSPALDQNSSSGEEVSTSSWSQRAGPPPAPIIPFTSTERRGRCRALLRTTGLRDCLALEAAAETRAYMAPGRAGEREVRERGLRILYMIQK